MEPVKKKSILAGMSGFSIVWFGQLISLLGTSMTGFATTIWAFEQTGRATDLALIGFFFVTPMLIMSPLAGVIVDRSNRKFIMMVSDLASGVATIGILILLVTGNLQIWHLYISSIVQGTFQTFQWPAYSAAITMMLPKEQYARANGMLSLADSGSNIFAPILAGALLPFIGFAGILIVDIVTFVFAVLALIIVHIPQPETTEAGKEGQGNMFKEAAYGFTYILQRPSLLGLQIVFLVGNFFSSLGWTLMAPMILSRSGNNELILGTTQTVGAFGGVLGGLIMTAWGGPKKLVHGVLLGWVFSSLLGESLAGLGSEVVVWSISSFAVSIIIPILNGSNQSIWQAKVAPDVQGRVFAIRRLIAWFVMPLSRLVAGPLADQLLEPAMDPAKGGQLVDTFSWLVGSGPGSGMALVLIFAGLIGAGVGISGYLFPAVRNAEEILPDHDAVEAVPAG